MIASRSDLVWAFGAWAMKSVGKVVHDRRKENRADVNVLRRPQSKEVQRRQKKPNRGSILQLVDGSRKKK